MMINYNHTVFVILLLSLGIFKLGSCSENQSQTNNVTVKCIKSEREALLRFKAGVFDIPGKLSSWVGEDCCQWNGVVCDNESGHVIKLNLSNPAGRHRHYEYPILSDRIPCSLSYCSGSVNKKRNSYDRLSSQSTTTSSLIHFKYLNYYI